jgi:hypothetical protein
MYVCMYVCVCVTMVVLCRFYHKVVNWFISIVLLVSRPFVLSLVLITEDMPSHMSLQNTRAVDC